MERGSTSYCVYTPGNSSPSRPPLRRAAPEQARSGFPFLIGMAALVLAVGVASVARFCPQDLRFESGGRHPAKSIAEEPTPVPATTATPVIGPTTFTTVGAADVPPLPAKKKTAHAPRSGLPAVRGSTAPTPSASAAPALPENPYAEPSDPEAYGF